MLKITAPYVRETCVIDDKEQKPVVVTVQPPGHTLAFRLRKGRQTWTIPMKDAYMYARGNAALSVSYAKPEVTRYTVKDEIVSVLRAEGKLNIAQVLQRLKLKRIDSDRARVGEWLEMLKQQKKVKQTGFTYELVK